MPVSYIPSAEQLVTRQKTTARKRRRNQNDEIEELGSLLPISAETIGAGKQQKIDKISVLRIASTYFRFQDFLQSAYGSNSDKENNGFSDLMSKAMDGFLLVLDGEGVALYTNETITEYVGLSQQDVIGQSLYELTHPDDVKVIQENLKPKGITPTQFRQFYIRFKSTVSPGRIQLSRFTSHIMVQVTGNLKLHPPGTALDKLKVLGLVAECQLIESSSSILELSMPQSSFTSTMSLDCKILSVDTRVKSVVGFDADDFVGTKIEDYFHPADQARMIPCAKLLLRTGHAVSPVFRFLTSSGEWVWVQLDGLIRFREETNEPQFLEVKVKVVSAITGKVKLIEQKEIYSANGCYISPEEANSLHPDHYFLDQIPKKPCSRSSEPIVQGLMGAQMSNEAIDTILHSRELGLFDLPSYLKMLQLPEGMQAPPPSSPPDATSSPLSADLSPPGATSSMLSSAQPSPYQPTSVTNSPYNFATNFSPPNSFMPHSTYTNAQAAMMNPSPSDMTPMTPSPQAMTGLGSNGSMASVLTDYSSGQSVTSPPSVGSSDLRRFTNQMIQSPPSVFSSTQSPDSGIGTHSILSPPSSFGHSPQGVFSPEDIDSQNHAMIQPQPSTNSFHFQQSTLSQSSAPVATHTNPQLLQQQAALWTDPSQPSPLLPQFTPETGNVTMTPDDADLEQLLHEAIALNCYSNSAPFADLATPPVPLSTSGLFNGVPSNGIASKPPCDQFMQGGLPANNFAASATVNVVPITCNNSTVSNGHTQQGTSEVQEILQQFM